MSRRRVVIAKSARNDLRELLEWYGEQGVPKIGERLLKAILDRMETLSRFPEMGRMVPEFGVQDLREILLPPYRIVYRVMAHEVQVVRVWRSERRLRMPDDDMP